MTSRASFSEGSGLISVLAPSGRGPIAADVPPSSKVPATPASRSDWNAGPRSTLRRAVM
jgi:hypothetical protein